jgi:hypothetical protein
MLESIVQKSGSQKVYRAAVEVLPVSAAIPIVVAQPGELAGGARKKSPQDTRLPLILAQRRRVAIITSHLAAPLLFQNPLVGQDQGSCRPKMPIV